MLLIQAAERAGLSNEAKLSWFFSVYVIGGLLNAILTLMFKIPFAGAHSITGIAFIGTVAADYSWPVLTGGFVLSGAIILAAGASGVFSKAFQAIPKPIIDALLAGLLLTYVLNIVPAAVKLPISGLFAVAGYFLLPRLTNLLSPPIWAMLMGESDCCWNANCLFESRYSPISPFRACWFRSLHGSGCSPSPFRYRCSS